MSNSNTFDLFVDDLRGMYFNPYSLLDISVAEIPQNEMVSYTAVVLDSTIPLKVTIAWYDYPQTEGFTGVALVNDVDLEVSSLTEEIR